MIGSEASLGKTVISDHLCDFFVFPMSLTEDSVNFLLPKRFCVASE